jgi:hypothetical protein
VASASPEAPGLVRLILSKQLLYVPTDKLSKVAECFGISEEAKTGEFCKVHPPSAVTFPEAFVVKEMVGVLLVVVVGMGSTIQKVLLKSFEQVSIVVTPAPPRFWTAGVGAENSPKSNRPLNSFPCPYSIAKVVTTTSVTPPPMARAFLFLILSIVLFLTNENLCFSLLYQNYGVCQLSWSISFA